MQLIWLGPLLGVVMGYFLAGGGVLGVVGAGVGALLGRQFDTVIQLSNGLYDAAHRKSELREGDIQRAFFDATFVCLGRIAKCDGVVCQAEINWTMQVMERMGLTPEKKQEAIERFDKGKSTSYDITLDLKRLQKACGRRSTLPQLFMEMLVQEALADGTMAQKEWAALTHIASTIQFSVSKLERLVRSAQASQDFNDKQSQQKTPDSSSDLLLKAYSVLGVSPTVTMAELKKAYRRQMNQHHPDKMIARGLPEEMVTMATEKTQTIHTAYEMIQKQHKTEKRDTV